MALFIIIIWVVIAAIFALKRAYKAQERIQACIDNGSLEVNGANLRLSNNLSDDQKVKLDLELRLHIEYTKLFPSLFKIHPKDTK